MVKRKPEKSARRFKLPQRLHDYFASPEHSALANQLTLSLIDSRDAADARWMKLFGRPFVTSADDLSELLSKHGESISSIVDSNSALGTADLGEVVRLLEVKMLAEKRRLERVRVVDDSEWPTLTKVAAGFSTNKGTVSRWIKPDGLRDNGKTGTERRIDPASILSYCETNQMAYNVDSDGS